MSFNSDYKSALDRDQAIDLVNDLNKIQYRFIDMTLLYVPGSATIRTNPNPTSTNDFAILDFYVDQTRFHVSTTLPAASYSQLLADSTPNELQTRHFLAPERRANVGCLCMTTSVTSVGEIIDVTFNLEIGAPARPSSSPVEPIRLGFTVESHSMQICAPIALHAVHKRRFTVPHPQNPKNVWFADFLSASKKFDLRHIYFVVAGQAQGDGPAPEVLKARELRAVRADDERFAPIKLADPTHANRLFDEMLAAKGASRGDAR